jgi:hypothetical protein
MGNSSSIAALLGLIQDCDPLAEPSVIAEPLAEPVRKNASGELESIGLEAKWIWTPANAAFLKWILETMEIDSYY